MHYNTANAGKNSMLSYVDAINEIICLQGRRRLPHLHNKKRRSKANFAPVFGQSVIKESVEIQ